MELYFKYLMGIVFFWILMRCLDGMSGRFDTRVCNSARDIHIRTTKDKSVGNHNGY